MLSSVEGEILGAAVRTGETCVNPVFVSVGSGISLNSALKLTLNLSKYRYCIIKYDLMRIMYMLLKLN